MLSLIYAVVLLNKPFIGDDRGSRCFGHCLSGGIGSYHWGGDYKIDPKVTTGFTETLCLQNTFFIQELDNVFARNYATLLLQESLADIVIFGTCELLGEKYFADFELLTLN